MDTSAWLTLPTAAPRPGLAGSALPRSTDTGLAAKPFAAVLRSASAARVAAEPLPGASAQAVATDTRLDASGIAQGAEEGTCQAELQDSAAAGGLTVPDLALPVWTPEQPPAALALMQWVVQMAGAAPDAARETETQAVRGQASGLRDVVAHGTLSRSVDSLLDGTVSAHPAAPLEGGNRSVVEAATDPRVTVPAVDLPTAARGGGARGPSDDGGSSLARTAESLPQPWQLATVGAPAAQAGAPIVAPAQTWIQTPVTQPGFSDDVVVELVRRVGQSEPGLQTVTLHLNPQSLGPVSVSIALSGQAVRVDFGASEALTRQHLEACLPGLAEALQAEGVALVHGQVHEATPQALAEAAAGASTGGADTGSEARARGEAAMQGQDRSSSGEREAHRETVSRRDTGTTVDESRAPEARRPAAGRAGRLDLVA